MNQPTLPTFPNQSAHAAPPGSLARLPTINPDGVSVKGCSYVYPPKGQAGEYSRLAANPYKNCGHRCAYCYVPLVLHISREEFNQVATPRENYLYHLIKDCQKYRTAGITEQVMLSFTTDPYHPGDTTLTAQTLKTLRDYGLGFCTLTKGGARALRDLYLFRHNRDAFASTLTTLDPEFSRKWEPGAALPAERIATLRAFHIAGIFTWVSLEPTLSPADSLEVVRTTAEFVDLYKIGKANYIPAVSSGIDWEKYTNEMIDLCSRLGVKHYIKKDLQQYLPAGYYNPTHIAQYH